jgi:hypothetical protein
LEDISPEDKLQILREQLHSNNPQNEGLYRQRYRLKLWFISNAHLREQENAGEQFDQMEQRRESLDKAIEQTEGEVREVESEIEAKRPDNVRPMTRQVRRASRRKVQGK